MSKDTIRVRFAPSPTGPLHIGGLRTALYNYLFARHHGGTFILRIEDTDQTRYVADAEPYILDALQWVGLAPDEGPGVEGPHGPYRQSERKALYHEHVQGLLDSGAAYQAFDTPEEIEAMREKYGDGHGAKYDHRTRGYMRNALTMSARDVDAAIASGTPYVIRLKVTPGEEVSFDDAVRGSVTFSSSELDDKVLMKSDGLPTYHMANVVDDLDMRISHVIRGEEWLSSTAHHVLLYKALGRYEDLPIFAHLPLILKPTGKGKLSKRDGAKLGIPVYPMNYEAADGTYLGFKDMGFLPEAVINFLAMLGWSPGDDVEVRSVEELVKAFSLDKVQSSGARFDMDKAMWFNQQHIQALTVMDLYHLVLPLGRGDETYDKERWIKIITLLQPRIKTINEFASQAAMFLEGPSEYDEKTLRKKWKEPGVRVYAAVLDDYQTDFHWTSEALKSRLEAIMKAHEVGFGQILPLLRLAVSGSTQGPDLFEVMAIIGRDDILRRLEAGQQAFHEISTNG